MKAEPAIEGILPADQMVGDDVEDLSKLRVHLQEARSYLAKFPWCRGIDREFFGLGVGGIVAVFLFEIDANDGVDRRLWVVSGDLPNAYLVTDQAPSAIAALRVYCDLMQDWVRAVREQGDLSSVFPVGASTTKENADLLEKRVRFLREEIIPTFEGPADS